jgi:hypothetical protein
MRRSTFNWKAALMVLVMIAPVLVNAFEPAKGLNKGTIYLKGGEVIKGYVAPLGQFPENGTLFVADQGGKETMIAHNRIEKVVVDNKTYIPSMIELNGSKVAAYLEQKTSGSANLYKAYFYFRKNIGKNNSTIQLQWSWVVSTPYHGAVALGQNPRPSQLANVLDHPVVSFQFNAQKLDENNIIKIVEEYNSAVASGAGEGPRM